MLERTIHRVWLGDRPMPEQFEDWWERFAHLHPGWVLRTWTDDELGWLQNGHLLAGCHNMSEMSDVIRFEIMLQHGGVYVDVDVEPLQSFQPLVASGAVYAGWEFSNRLGTATLVGPPGHPAWQALVDRMPGWIEAHDDMTSEKRTGPVFLTETWWKRTDVERLHRDAFYPVGWFEKHKLGGPYPPNSFSVHHWAGSWVVET